MLEFRSLNIFSVFAGASFSHSQDHNLTWLVQLNAIDNSFRTYNLTSLLKTRF